MLRIIPSTRTASRDKAKAMAHIAHTTALMMRSNAHDQLGISVPRIRSDLRERAGPGHRFVVSVSSRDVKQSAWSMARVARTGVFWADFYAGMAALLS